MSDAIKGLGNIERSLYSHRKIVCFKEDKESFGENSLTTKVSKSMSRKRRKTHYSRGKRGMEEIQNSRKPHGHERRLETTKIDSDGSHERDKFNL